MRLQELSESVAGIVERAARWVVRVEGRRRGPSSGVVWSAEGVVATAHHVLERDEEIGVGLPDGAAVKAGVIGRDPATDVALLRVPPGALEAPPWAEPEGRRPGELVLALSRPGRSARARLGVLHAVAGEWRAAGGARVAAHLESDIGVQLGFSGGLLLAADGRALGMNTTGLLRGAALAVPAPTLRRVAGALLERGRVRRGFLGLGTQPVPLTPDLVEATGQAAALLVVSVQPDAPAFRAGLRLGDALLTADGAPLRHPGELLPFLDEDRVGRPLRLRMLRAGEARELTLTVGERG
jgi:S1-C subfamily serine protease